MSYPVQENTLYLESIVVKTLSLFSIVPGGQFYMSFLPQSQHYVGEVGTVIQLYVGMNLSTATLNKISVEKPDNSTTLWAGSVVNDYNGNPTIIQYTTQAGDFNLAGVYKIQGDIASPSWTGLTPTVSFVLNAAFN